MKEMDRLSSELLFEIQKAFYDERGRGARYRVTTVGLSYMNSAHPGCFSSLENVKKALFESGMVEKINLKEEDVSVTAEVEGCYFKKLRDRFISAGMQPLSCPIANIIMQALERKTGLSPELLPITAEGTRCLVTMAKQASADIVKE
ncbi:MAG TPA: hypothetical protein PLG79_08165 [Spirochaetales bacterium]|nr:hypothetical protein [Spirochaetales bacterium]HOV38681.1 hypothetical protein [Spirochaetales bacterium]